MSGKHEWIRDWLALNERALKSYTHRLVDDHLSGRAIRSKINSLCKEAKGSDRATTMPFHDTPFDSDTLKVLVSIYERVCDEFFVTGEEQRNGVVRRLIRATMDGVTDPDLLMAAAVRWLRKHRSDEQGNGDALKAKGKW